MPMQWVMRALRSTVPVAVVFVMGQAHAREPASNDPGDVVASATVEDVALTPTPKAERKWIKHRVVPRETIDDIAARYGVTRTEIVRWNKHLQDGGYIYAGRSVKVWARRQPPPREKITYVVQKGDTWSGIAKEFGIEATDLRNWNRGVPKSFRAGTRIVVYTNPAEEPIASAIPEEEGSVAVPVPEIRVRPGGMAIGRPNRGRLSKGVQCPESDMLHVRDPDKAWGTSHTILYLQKAVASFRAETGYEPKLQLGAISLRSGGRFRPHSSHQNGRDVDLRLPKRPGADPKSGSADDIDWALSWELVEALIDTGEVQYIFLDYARQKRLLKAAKAAGASDTTIARSIQYPRAKKTNNGIVRHADGHNIHIHIRFKCARDNYSCDSR
jgi:LysM repeat protein